MRDGVPPTMGRRIAECREARGWIQRKLADAAGLSVTFLSEIENDRRKIGSDALLRIADALGVSVDYLLKGSLESPRPQLPLVIPAALAHAADEHRWSVSETRDLMKAHQMVLARRGQSLNADDRERPLSRDEWVDLHRRLFGDEEAG